MTERSAVGGMVPCTYVVVGASHRSSNPGLRDRIFVADTETISFLSGLAAAGVPQCLVMSTCDRVEIQAAAADPGAAGRVIRNALARRANEADMAGEDPFYTLTGEAAVRHVFAVASSLDSVVVGESQVLGQLKEAHRAALQTGCIGSELEALLQAAYATAKDVRSGTGIAEGPVSMAAAAVRVARDLHGDIAGTEGLLIGGGDMGLLMLEQFRHAGMTKMTVAASSAALADSLARAVGGHAATFDDIEDCLVRADIVVSAAGLGRYLVTTGMMRAALRQRRHKPVFAIDAGVPGDIEPEIDRLADAFRYDLDDLEEYATRNREARNIAADQAWAIVERHVAAFGRNRAGRQAVPALAGLRDRFERIRREVLAGGEGLDAEELTRRLVNRLLHDPSEALRRHASDGDIRGIADAACELFRIGRNDDGDDGDPDAPDDAANGNDDR